MLGRSLFEVLPDAATTTPGRSLARVLAGEQVVLQGQAFRAAAPGHYDAYLRAPAARTGSCTAACSSLCAT